MQDSFRVPAKWLPEILGPAEEFAWASRRRRIAVWSRAGWLLADRPLGKGERHDSAVRSETSAHSRDTVFSAERLTWAASPRASLGGELKVAPALKFWLECTLPAIRAWLSRAMGLDQPDFAGLVESLLLVPGELFVTPTRIDFRAPLDQTRIPVRRAALDLDPGWLPAWGRSIRFHYGDTPGGLR